ncbi:hypothetical protein [Streptomyces sp. cg35]|uniref:hypothetical protein n=1 Tax=Streptomyces sp. cg35 TaxID=3421650 RepID=UPI003D17EADA
MSGRHGGAPSAVSRLYAEIAKFGVVGLCGIVVNLAAFNKFTGIGVATLFRFWSYRTWVFKRAPQVPVARHGFDTAGFVESVEETLTLRPVSASPPPRPAPRRVV